MGVARGQGVNSKVPLALVFKLPLDIYNINLRVFFLLNEVLEAGSFELKALYRYFI